MPNRILKESLVTSDTVDALTVEEERFFVRLLVVCDDYGRMDARPAILRARCFPLKASALRDEDLAAWLEGVRLVGLVGVYEVDGRDYLQVLKWEKHQRPPRAKESKFPDAPSAGFRGHPRTSDSIRGHLTAEKSDESGNPISAPSVASGVEDSAGIRGHLTANAPVIRDSGFGIRDSGIGAPGASAVTKRPRVSKLGTAYEGLMGRLLGGQHSMDVGQWIADLIQGPNTSDRIAEAIELIGAAKKRGEIDGAPWGAIRWLVENTPVDAPFVWGRADANTKDSTGNYTG